MYNNERKEEYISSLPNYENKETNERIRILFQKLEPHEEDEQKDLCDMSLGEAKQSIEMLGLTSMSTKMQTISHLRKYVQWCILKGYAKTKENRIDLILAKDLDDITFVKSKFFGSLEQLQKFIDSVFTDEQVMYKAMCYLLWIGYSENELPNIKKTDVNFSNNSICHNGKTFKNIPKNIMDLFKECINVKTIFTTNKTQKYNDTQYLLRSLENKKTKTDKIVIAYIKTIISDNSKDYRKNENEKLYITSKRIWESGCYYRIYEYEKNGGEVKDILVKEFDIVPDQYKLKGFRKTNDYINWKRAFYS
jgi:hypothetical protein